VRKSRVKLSRKASAVKFSKGAKVNKKNSPNMNMRGGIRL
jgi:hypothetical protein